MSRRIASDIGGTFTDVVSVDEVSGELTVAKRLTTPPEFARGLLEAIGDAPLDDVAAFIHGTTVVINAITERTGARTGLVATAGFRDVLEIGRGNRPDMYNLRSRKPVPFVPRRHRFEVRERVDRNGDVLRPLVLDDLDAVVEACRRDGLEALAVCLLHSYARPDHERQCRGHLQERLPGVSITISSDVTREWREYERTSTVVLNAYVQPSAGSYLRNLSGALRQRGLRSDVHLMQSNGGTATLEAAAVRPISLIESGPAAGIIGAAAVGHPGGDARRDLPRHRWHDGKVQPDRRRRAEDDDRVPARMASGLRRLPGPRPRHRRRRDRGRRRQHRLGRPRRRAAGRTEERRGRSRAGLLRQRRPRAHGHRREATRGRAQSGVPARG